MLSSDHKELLDAATPLKSLDVGAPRSLVGRLRRIASRPGFIHTPLSLLDQTIVSGTSFLTTVMIGRVCGAEELGVYSLAFTLVVLLTNLQTAVLSTPYTIHGNRLSGQERHEFAGSVFVHCLMFMAATSLCLALIAIGLFVFQPSNSYIYVMWGLAASMPLLLLREFVRRFAFTHFQILTVLAVDISATVIHFFGLWLLLQNELLTTVNAYLVIAVSCAIASGIALAYLKNGIAVRWHNVFPELGRSWLLGRWLAATRGASLVQSYAVYWILAGFIGTAATGVYAACMTLLMAANPFIIGIGNLLEPQAARALAQGGVSQMRRVVWHATLLLGSVMGLYCGALVFFGGWIVPLLFKGQQFENQGAVIAILALGTLTHVWATGSTHGLRILERPDLSFRASILSLVITLTLSVILVPLFGLLGGAWAVFAGDIAATTMRWIVFLQVSKERDKPVAST
ncbi:MAG: lipopolysaccharide biosynthesis protein [Pirellulaceae bacterium]